MTVSNAEHVQTGQRRSWPALACVLVLALTLRLIRLGTFSYWHDEVHNLIASEDLYALVVHGNLISNHPPLPYILVAFWRAIGLGGSEWTMRLLPVMFGVGGIAAVYALGRRLFGERAGIFAAFLLAVSPLHLHHSQDLKEYIYLPFVAALMVLWLYRAMDSNRMRDWLVYGVLAGLACYTEIFVGPLLIAINLWAIFLLRSKPGLWRGWLAGNALAVLLFLPWLGIMYQRAVATMVKAENWWVPPPSLAGAGFYFKAVAFGYSGVKPWFKIAFFLYIVLVAAGFVRAFRINRRGALLLATWAAVPVGIVYGISLITESIFLIRAMLPYAIALYILAGVGLAHLRPRWVQAGMFAFVCVVAGVGLFHEYQRDYPPIDFPHRPGTHPPRDYSGAAKYILAHWQDGDIVVHCADATWLPFYWYGFRGMPQYFAGVGGRFIAEIKMGNPRNTTDPLLDNYWPQEPQRIVPGAKRVWFVFGEWERKYLVGNATDAYRWMDAHFTEVENHPFRGLDVLLYMPPESVTPFARDEDDGVSARVSTKLFGTYNKVKLDNAIVPRSIEQRKGNLVLRWVEPSPTVPAGPNFSQTQSTKAVAFSVRNATARAISAKAAFLASDAIVDAPSLLEQTPEDEVWRVWAQYNPSPPPPCYDTPTATAHLASPGSATLAGTVTIPPGVYDVYMYVLGVPGDIGHSRARLAVTLGQTPVYEASTPVSADPWSWGWRKGNTVAGGESRPLQITAECLDGAAPAYADISALAFVGRRGNGESARLTPLAWPGDLTIGPDETQVFTCSVDEQIPRCDVWVYEGGEDGQAYHILRID